METSGFCMISLSDSTQRLMGKATVIFGHWGDFANLTGRTLSGPQGELQTAVNDLTTIQAGLTNSDDRRQLAAALDLLDTALNSPAWIDSSHLQADSGQDVFADEEAAARAIADLIQHSPGAAVDQQMEDDLRQVGLSAEELAQIAIADAGDHGCPSVADAGADGAVPTDAREEPADARPDWRADSDANAAATPTIK